MCNEASFLSTGFSTYGLEIMKRLHATGKYELAEFASFGSHNDARKDGLPWKYYHNLPVGADEEEIYIKKMTNEFGEWKFESVALDFKPDIVFDVRDVWMNEYQERSPFRHYFKWVLCPTVDSMPQDDVWISMFMNADKVLTYSDWGLDILRKQSNNLIRTVSAAPPGIDISAYKVPLDKKNHRDRMGLKKDIFLIGTVMRNQRRKLYPDLIEAFATFLKEAPEEIASKTYLYMHCAFPDIGWDIPRLIKEAGVANRCLFTYYCQNCSLVFPSFYQDVVGICRECQAAKAVMPTTKMGITRTVLADILGMFDAYVQYSTCEGFGLPQIEAAACGVPVFAVDYSAMSDVVRKINGFPVKVQRYFRECETHTYKALPDNGDLVKQLIDYFSLPEVSRKSKGVEVRKAVDYHYNWDKTAKIWEDCFDSLNCPNQKSTWLSPANIFNPSSMTPHGLTNEEFIRWGLKNIANRPDLTNSYLALRMIRDLNWTVFQEGVGGLYTCEESHLTNRQYSKQFTRNEASQFLFNICQQNNFWELERTKGI